MVIVRLAARRGGLGPAHAPGAEITVAAISGRRAWGFETSVINGGGFRAGVGGAAGIGQFLVALGGPRHLGGGHVGGADPPHGRAGGHLPDARRLRV